MISNIRFKSGSIPGAENLQIETTPVTVFVGPNNSGKSRVLMEIEQFCVSGTKHASMKLLEELTFKPIAASDLEDALSKVRQKPNPGEVYQTDSLIVGSRRGRTHVKVNRLHELLKNPQSDPHFYCVNYLQHTLLRLDGPSRIGLVNQQQAGDLQAASPQGTFNVLFRDDAKRLEVRRIIREAVGLHFVVDPTNLGQFRIRLSQRETSSPQEERGIDDAAIKFHNDALLIDQASDGIKAFTGLMIEIVAGDPAILLIDEPEAFLHPSLASKLGSEVASAATKTNKRVFVSTHSSSFLMGCIQARVQTQLIRSNRRV